MHYIRLPRKNRSCHSGVQRKCTCHPDPSPIPLQDSQVNASKGAASTKAVCSMCGKELSQVLPCPYNWYGKYTCPACCQECYEGTPFPCMEYHLRRNTGGNEEPSGKLAEF